VTRAAVGRWANWATKSWAARKRLTSWATGKKIRLGCAADWARSREGEERENKFFLPFSKELTKLEFKHKFEFKQIKTMQQHVCNSKPL
jgi:hypothetical protein